MVIYRHRQRRWVKVTLSCMMASLLLLLLANTLQLYPLGKASIQQDVRHQTLQKRQILTWNRAVAKGNALSCLMENNAANAQAYMNTYKPGVQVASQWMDFASIAAWGWESNNGYTEPGFENTLDSVFTSLGVKVSDNVPKQWVQSRDVTMDGIDYRVSLI